MEYHKDNDSLEAFFRQHLEGYAEEPPVGALDNIRQRLAQRRKGRWKGAAMFGLLLLGTAMVVGFLAWERNQSSKIEALEQELANIQLHNLEAPSEPAVKATQPFIGTSDEMLQSKKAMPPIANNHIPRRPVAATYFSQKTSKEVVIAGGNNQPPPPIVGSVQNVQAEKSKAETAQLETTRPAIPASLLFGELKQFEKPGKTPLSLTVGRNTPHRLIAGEAYMAYLPLNGGGGLQTGSRWHLGLLAKMVERPRWSLSLGVEYGIYTPEVQEEAGITWSEQDILSDPEGNQFTSFSKVLNTGFGQHHLIGKVQYLPAGDNLDQLTFDYLRTKIIARTRIEMLALPLIMRWQFGNPQWRWHLKGGFGVANIMRHSTSFETSFSANERPGRYRFVNAQSEEISSRLEKATFQAYLGFGVAWRLNHRHSILIEPTSVISLSKLGQGQGMNTRPWALGLQVGVHRSL